MVNSPVFSWVLNNALRLFFPLTLPWAPLFLSADFFYSAVPERGWLHNIIEYLLVPGFLIASIIFSILLYRLWPGFLRVEGRVPILFVLKKIILRKKLYVLAIQIKMVLYTLANLMKSY